MAVPNNAAEALARLLRSLVESNTDQFGDAWAQVLNAGLNTPEFIRRHSAVVGLVSEIQLFLESLPADDELREQHLADMSLYYGVVIYQGDWSQRIIVSGLIDDPHLRLLASLGSGIRYRGVVPQVSDADADQLRESLRQWESLLDETVLPEGIEEEIRAQLATIYDLLGQVEVLGYGPVVKEVETLFGKAVRVAKYVEDAKKVAGCVTGLFAFLTHLSVNDWGEATNALVGAFQVMGEALDIAHKVQHPMKAIESKQQPELEGKPADAEGIEVVDVRERGDGHDDDEGAGS